MTSFAKTAVVSTIASIFIFLFVYTALSKLLHFSQFAHTLSQSTILHPFANLVAWIVPVTELATALLLFTERSRIKGLLVAFALMLSFTIYIGYMLTFETNIPCSCGGVLRSLTWTHHLQLNQALLVLSVIGLLSGSSWRRKTVLT
jgi:hypothetical protein